MMTDAGSGAWSAGLPGSPRVSVGLPVYNGARYIACALDSLLAQTYTDFEIVISDNGSTDETQAICEQYAAYDARIRYIRQDVNRGGVWNYNEVVRLARGEYFRWHAHDDACAPHLLAATVAVLDARPEVVLCMSNSVIIDENGAHVMLLQEHLNLSDPSPARRMAAYHQHDRDCPLCSVYFSLVRRALLVQTPLMQGFINSEATIVAELALLGRFWVIDDYAFYRRDHAQNTTSSLPRNTQRVAWYRPNRKVRYWDTHPGWRQLVEQLRIAHRVALPPAEKMRVLGVIVRFFFDLVRGVVRPHTKAVITSRPKS
jgi:glycosyltransferase involved in cell wall biosynthesis